MTAGAETICLVYAAEDTTLAEAIATELSSYGLKVSGDDGHSGDLAGGLLRGAAAVVVLCTPGGMRRRALRRRAGMALLYAQRHPGVVLVPLLLDPAADPTTMFGPYEWLAPASTAPAHVAAAIFAVAFGRSSPSRYDQHPPAAGLEQLAAGSPREAFRVADRAMAQARMVRRLLWSAVVTVVVLMGVLAALLLVGNQGGRASLLIMAFPLIGFAAALATLRPAPRDR